MVTEEVGLTTGYQDVAAQCLLRMSIRVASNLPCFEKEEQVDIIWALINGRTLQGCYEVACS